jgi:antitoxin component YwqK of YwqJK toxin-antitoxin module
MLQIYKFLIKTQFKLKDLLLGNESIDMKYVYILSLFIYSTSFFAQDLNMTDDKGRKQGAWEIYSFTNKGMANEDSVLMMSGPYKNNRKHGIWSIFDSEEKLKTKQQYKFDRKLGDVAFYYSNGKIRETGVFVKGKYRGADQKYYETGCLYYNLLRDSLGKKMIELYYQDNCSGNEKGSLKDSVSYIPEEDKRIFKDESLFKIGTTHQGELVKGKYESLANKSDENDCAYVEEIKLLGENFTGSNEIKNKEGKTLVVGVFNKGVFYTGEMHCYDDNGKLLKSKFYEDKKIIRVTRFD